ADNIAQLSLGADVLLLELCMVSHVNQAFSQYRQSFFDDKAITDENFGEGPTVSRRWAITEPAFGNIE
ncbi:MAG: hypothetical protein U1C55_02985, partial [Smithellaceae bacterium]|nr:hypothetical protein [Smithellaceae bacterium]